MRHWAALAGTLALCACGGSGTGSNTGPVVVTPTPSPAPTPTPSPTPTPTPTPTPSGYTTFAALTGTQTLQSASASLIERDPPSVIGVNAYGQGVPLIYDAGVRSYTFNNLQGSAPSQTFTTGELQSGQPAGVDQYLKSNGNALSIIVPNGNVEQYVRLYDLFLMTDPARTRILGVAGVPTQSNDIPTQGSVTYRLGRLYGRAYIRANAVSTLYQLSHSTVTLTIDYAAQRITTQITFIGTPQSGADVTLGTLSGSTSFQGTSTSFIFSSTQFPQLLSAVATGALFGPQGAEAGLALSLDAQGQQQGLSLAAVGSAVR